MLQQQTAARLVSLVNATKILKIIPQRSFGLASASTSTATSTTGGLFHDGANLSWKTTMETPTSRHDFGKASVQQQLKLFSSSSHRFPLSPPMASPPPATIRAGALHGHAIRRFSQRANFWIGNNAAKACLSRSRTIQQQLRSYAQYRVTRRRPIRLIFKMMAASTALVAIPAILLFGAPIASIVFIPIAIGGIFGGAILLTGGILFFVLPVVAVGGALTFWLYAMPAAVTAKDLNKILKRAKSGETVSALSALGQDWELQRAKPDEWFRWEFPHNENSLDRISIRMAVFDPNDSSARKQRTMKWLDNIETNVDENNIAKWEVEAGEDGEIVRRVTKSSKHFEVHNNSDKLDIESLYINRDNDHLIIEIKDDGEKLLKQKWGKKYLELAKVIDQAASELEMEGHDLGEQVVLVRKDKGRSFWNKFSLGGDIALRIPFNRTWVHDVTDE
ncbi:hypothetical protein BC939DRAFT_434920 [Gamsiella multidivaricata]|uniref:uncharacterized protein n=1 Tax=Gamsiella multidivaricata TaxID=101098 RepID=UPI00221EB7D3|nr:uncharacterized protein BC939DRAFT_434920 [Gamsiella multidivaricata]KAG0370590.1 hypothetical protein BGZ54_005495 [Gamsiella multidivaricata]KAI7832226.1 hypothetical protein BC939DRAFT_434920 [Gamsiella multidivaricata]